MLLTLRQRQAKPPKRHLKNTTEEGARSSAKGGDTEVDSEDDTPWRKKTKLGNLGRRNATKAYGDSKAKPGSSSINVRRPSSSPVLSPKPTAFPEAGPAANDSTATESESEAGSPRGKKSKSSTKESPKPKPRLGVLKSQRDQKSHSPSSSSEDEGRAPPTTRSQKKPRQDTQTPEPRSSPAPASQRRRLGRLNKTTELPPTRSASSTPEADDLDGSQAPQTRASQQRHHPPINHTTPTRRLGRLGGGRKARTPSASPSPRHSSSRKKAAGKPTDDVAMPDDPTGNNGTDSEATPSPSPSASSQPTTRQYTTRSSPNHAKKPGPSPTTAKPTAEKEQTEEKPPKEEETDEAKANRRREELKRTIASGAGVRKKRRF